MDVQAHLSLIRGNMSEGTFSHVSSQLNPDPFCVQTCKLLASVLFRIIAPVDTRFWIQGSRQKHVVCHYPLSLFHYTD